ncbi:ATP-binding protein [Singulisphaera sp. PoT]|uniref:sensor histidine kinase n=1 Tax=Singulisphaera sp. PoT TaxID=3411797 RepID=UPI003BF4B483
MAVLSLVPLTPAAGTEAIRRVLVLYPSSEGQPGNLQFDQGLRSTFKSSSRETIELYNEYLDTSRFPGEDYQRRLAEFLRRKYADRKIDVVIPGLAPSLDFVLKFREPTFTGVPIVYGAVERGELEARKIGAGIAGVPMRVDLESTLSAALRLHPDTRRVVVVAGKSATDSYRIAEARRLFHGREGDLEFVYLAGLPMDELLDEVAHLPAKSLIYYLHIFEDGRGKSFVPAEAAGLVASAANAPVYGHDHTYLGRGIVGGCPVSFHSEGVNAARVSLRVLAGEKPESIIILGKHEYSFMFDWRQIRRWGIDEDVLPHGSIIFFKEPSYWDLYGWRISGVVALCILEALLIVGLLLARAKRRRAEAGLRESQRELRALTGRLLQAQESERRRIARELHDDLNQGLALLAVQLDLLSQEPSEDRAQVDEQLRGLSDRVKQLSSAVHGLATHLHPSKLEQLGLVAAIRSLCKEQTQVHGVAIEFLDRSMPSSVPADTALSLYRIAQEALHNVIKHSGTRQARVELFGDEGGVSLRIVDHGAGFESDTLDGKEGLGLVSMRERLRLVGGEIRINSRPGAGTQIDVHVPLAPSGPESDGRSAPSPSSQVLSV